MTASVTDDAHVEPGRQTGEREAVALDRVQRCGWLAGDHERDLAVDGGEPDLERVRARSIRAEQLAQLERRFGARGRAA